MVLSSDLTDAYIYKRKFAIDLSSKDILLYALCFLLLI